MGMMAEKGDKFLWMSWAATVIIFVDVLIWIIDYFDERSMRGLVPYNSYVDNRGYESELKSIKAETKEINAINKAARKAAKAERAPMTMATIPTRRPRGVIGPAVGEVSRRGIVSISRAHRGAFHVSKADLTYLIDTFSRRRGFWAKSVRSAPGTSVLVSPKWLEDLIKSMLSLRREEIKPCGNYSYIL